MMSPWGQLRKQDVCCPNSRFLIIKRLSREAAVGGGYWPGPAYHTETSIRPTKPFCSGRYDGHNRHSGTKNISISLGEFKGPEVFSGRSQSLSREKRDILLCVKRPVGRPWIQNL